MDVVLPLIEFLPLGVIAVMIATSGFPAAERRFLRPLALAAFVVRLAVATMFVVVPTARVFHEDTAVYEGYGRALASYWRGEGMVPPFGTATEMLLQPYPLGFLVLCGVLYYVFGRFQLVVTCFTAMVGALTVILVYRLAAKYFHPLVARRAALLTAFFPSMILWSAMALKDPMMIPIVLVCLAATFELRRAFTPGSAATLLLFMVFGWFIRYYVIYFLLVGIAAALVFVRRTGAPGQQSRIGVSRQLVAALVVLGIFSMLGLTGRVTSNFSDFSLDYVAHYRAGMASSANSAFSADADVSTPGRALAFLPIGISVLLFGPFPWQMISLRPLLTLPEMLVWWAMIPALWRGLVHAVRHELGDMAPLLMFSISLIVVYALALGNVGAAFRMRAQILGFLFVFAALGHYVKVCRRKGLDPIILGLESGAAERARLLSLAHAAAARTG